MTRTREKRKYPRIEAKIKVEFKSLKEFMVEHTRNLSRGGIFLRTDRLLDPNAEVDLTMTFPSQLGEFQVRGRVVRLTSQTHPDVPGQQLYGVGISFMNPNSQMIEVIEKLIRESPSRAL